MWFVEETEMDDLGVAGNLRAWEFRARKRKLWSRICQRTKLEWVRITLCFWTRASLEFESVEETQKLETDTGIAGLK